MAFPRVTPRVLVGNKGEPLRGMVRQGADIALPPTIARLLKNARTKDMVIRRREGAHLHRVADAIQYGALYFDGTSDRRVTFPDSEVLDLKTKWGIHVYAKTDGTPGADQYLFTRDVNPTSAGKKTFALGITSQRRLFFEMDTSDGTARDLAAAAGSLVAADTGFSALIVRDGVDLSLHLDGNPTPALSRADLSATLNNIAGTQKAIVGLNSNDNGVANFTNLFKGTIAVVTIFLDYTDVETLLRYTSKMKYPDPQDARVGLYAPFTYEVEQAGTVAYDWSTYRNHGTIVGAPTRVADIVQPAVRGQVLTSFEDPDTGLLQNLYLIAGVLYVETVRPGA